MQKTTVDLECSGQFSSFFIDYIQQKSSLHDFYNQSPTIENFGKIIAERDFDPENRKVLVKVLQKQYSGFKEDDPIHLQIATLGQNNTYTVTTGHQLNLFTGPLYFIYKIVSTINLAEKLQKAYPNNHFVPVYWMASEDHDFEEINHFVFEGRKYEWNTDQKGAVGNFALDQSFKEYLKGISFVPDFFKEAYLGSRTLSEAVRKYVHHLFGDKGLVVVDGMDANLKRQFIPFIQEDLIKGSSGEKVSAQTKKLDGLGYKTQIFPREINFFYMEDGLRERIEKVKGKYQVLNTDISFEEKEILELVDIHPEKFSPNVVLRPLYQEQILPNLGYIGGPAELIYWLQLKPLFDHFHTPFPIILPRNFAVVLEQPVLRKIKKLGLKDEDLFLSFEAWKRNLVSSTCPMDFQLEEEKRQVSFIYGDAGRKAAELDITLKPAFEAGKVRAMKMLDHLGNKIRKAEERRNKEQIGQMISVKEALFPGGSPQERVENFMKFYLEDSQFMDKLMANFDPLKFDFMILKLDNE